MVDADSESEYGDEPLYASAKRIYPQKVRGVYRRIKWILLCVTLGIYYLLPFVRWDRGPNEPHQAVLVDLAHRRFYFFFIEIWPQEVYYLTGLLILAAMTLFLMNALAGRVWCGYLCPQTVWTDLFIAVERLVEGDRRERMQKDAGPWTLRRLREKTLKHALWLIIAWWTGGAWVLYFDDAPTLVRELATFQAPGVAWVWIGILTFTTYALAGTMREQVCLYMCPWPRIQAAMTDENALNVTYRLDRGEPRMSLKKATAARVLGEAAGDCIDCGQCVAVCPTGVDIRGGDNLGCIQCGLCIDACDAVMKKIDRPVRLIAYDNAGNIERRRAGKPNLFKPVRARTILYVVVIALVGGVMTTALATRVDLGVSAIHDRNPMFVKTVDGSIRNGYSIRILNRSSGARSFAITAEGAETPRLEAIGVEPDAQGRVVAQVGPDQTRELRVLATLPAGKRADQQDMTFRITDVDSGATAVARDHFDAP
ncbi:MAG: cytochrome c oxidase accessory protein CcoG [Roseiarcus sp.]